MSLDTTVTTDRSQYPSNRAVEILVRMTNNGRAKVAYRVTRFEYEIQIRESRSRRVVWTWSKGKTPATPFPVLLQPGQWRQHLELWDGRDDSGKRVPAGVYEIEATHMPENRSDTIQVYLNNSGTDKPAPVPGGGGGSVSESILGNLRADKTVAKLGESVGLTYTITNSGKDPIVVPFSTGKQFEIEAYQATGTLLWSHTREQAYMQMLTRITLAPGETKSFSSVWRVNSRVAGIVNLSGFLTSAPGGPSARASASITITK